MEGKIFVVATLGLISGVLAEVFVPQLYSYFYVLVGFSILYLVGSLITKQGRLICVTACMCAVCLGMYRASIAPQVLPVSFKSLLNTSVSLTGNIVADPDIRTKNQQILIQVQSGGQKTCVLAFASRAHRYWYGETVEVSGELQAPQPFATDGGRVFRYDQYLAKKDVFATIPAARLTVVSPPRGIFNYALNVLFAAKHAFIYGLDAALPQPYSGIAEGILTGDQHQLDASVLAVLESSGLIWIVVLSGYHVTIIAKGIEKIFQFAPVLVQRIAAFLCVIAVVFATGASAPSLRGGMMALLAMYAEATGRSYDSIRALCLTIIALILYNPLLIAYDSGFQLSCIVTPAIILVMPALERHLLFIRSTLLRESIAISFVAQLAVIPLLMYENGMLETWAIPANIFFSPFVPFAMATCLVAGVSGLFLKPLASILAWPAKLILYYLLVLGKYASMLPFANLTLAVFSFWYVILMYMILLSLSYILIKIDKEKILR